MYNFEEEQFHVNYKRPEEKTLGEDFYYWWRMGKYSSNDIEAKKFSDVEIKVRHGDSIGWPGTVKVTYWVELENGYAVGYSELEKGKATFPVAALTT